VIILDAKILGGIQLIGALVAGYLSWQVREWSVLILALLFLITAVHHLAEKKHK